MIHKLKIIILSMFPVSAVLLGLGLGLNYLWMTILGGVMLGLDVLAVNVLAFLDIRKMSKQHLESEDRRKSEGNLIEDVNSSAGIENRTSFAVYRTSNIMNTWNKSTKLDKAMMIILPLIVLCGIVAFTVLLCFGLFIPMAIVLGCLFVIVLLAILILRLRAKKLISQDGIDYMSQQIEGEVIACYLISDTTTQTRTGNKIETEKTRIKTTIYKIRVKVGDEEISTYSTKLYNEGDKIFLRKHKRKKKTYIIDE